MHRYLVLLILTALSAAVLAGAAPAQHYIGWHFYRTGSIQVIVVDHTPATFDSALQYAVNNWNNRVSAVQLGKAEGTVDPTLCNPIPTTPVIHVCSAYYGAPASFPCGGTYAWAACYFADNFTNGHSDRGRVFLNQTHIGVNTNNAQSAFCHELGHGFGLDHRLSSYTCMYSFNGPMYPDSYDGSMLTQDIYAFIDGHGSHTPGQTGCCDAGSLPRLVPISPLAMLFGDAAPTIGPATRVFPHDGFGDVVVQ